MLPSIIVSPIAGLTRRHRVRKNRKSGSALVITLIFLVIVTILVVGLFNVVRLERRSANSNLESVRARALSQMAVDHAVALIQDATTAAEATTSGATTKFWASQPGRITVFNADGTVDNVSSRDLHSGKPSATDTDVAELNQPSFGGNYPIASAAAIATAANPKPTPPSSKVKWVNVLQDNTATASKTNPIVGRYAFWVDDELAKLNVNTADASAKYLASSFGAGAPTEVSLQALTTSGAGIGGSLAEAIGTQCGARPNAGITSRLFNDPSEILQVAGAPASLLSENNFSLSNYNRASELNIFGEPKIYLMQTGPGTAGNGKPAVLNAMIGPYVYSGTGPSAADIYGASAAAVLFKNTSSNDLTQVYPASAPGATPPPNGPYGQLPPFSYTAKSGATSTSVKTALPQYFNVAGDYLTPTSIDYAMGMRIAKYLKGQNSQGNAINWPVFPGSGSAGFAGKYTDRQIDSITLQILDQMERGIFADHYRLKSLPFYMAHGFLSNQLVFGRSNLPQINEVQVTCTTYVANPPKVYIQICVEWYLPKEYKSTNDHTLPIDAGDTPNWRYGSDSNGTLNFQDTGYWQDNLLSFVDQDNVSVIDLRGRNPAAKDPDPRAVEIHGRENGSGPLAGRDCPVLQMFDLVKSNGWRAGDYHTSINKYCAYAYEMKAGTTSITIKGGLAIMLRDNSNERAIIDVAPLDSLHGPFLGEGSAGIIRDAVIPINVTFPVDPEESRSATVVMQVDDSSVNKFPGDWHSAVSSLDVPNFRSSDGGFVYTGGDRWPTVYPSLRPFNGDNYGFKAANGGDPGGYWWPEQNVNIPKSQRFPSAGYLQYIHTGVMPDKATDALSATQQKGTPFRLLNFAPSNAPSQRTQGGDSYPDWAMLDLFTVPAALQPVGSPPTAVPPPPLQLTWGGATIGRLNPNSALEPFADASETAFSRTRPLEGILKNLQTSTAYDSSNNQIMSTVDEKALAVAIDKYVANLGRPLMLPGEICNIPEVAAYVYGPSSGSASSRNDLVRQIVGNLSTRSNTFTVWAVGQTIKKRPSNTNYAVGEASDIITGESRMKFLVERYLDLGADGVPGNAANPGPDGVVGTPDDVVDTGTNANNPAMTYPLHYKYRILSASQTTN